ncbi:MAG: methionine gamma-lyase family protein [Peptococcaceae bacterium]|jgi:cystathionine beta-lyase family protein involved in aluminum resistance|nr:methionine gamma-lyase family protein [Peptococcaceae bacterium]
MIDKETAPPSKENACGMARELLEKEYQIPRTLLDTMAAAESGLEQMFARAEAVAAHNQLRLLRIFQRRGATDFHLQGSTGYGYGDKGRALLEEIFAEFFGGEAALARGQIISGTHALSLGLYGNLRPGDELISAAGRPYDTLLKIIGRRGEADTLLDQGIGYREIPLAGDGHIDLPRLLAAVGPHTRMALLQRSKGYDWRPAVSLAELAVVIAALRQKKPDLICLVDNCYCEMVEPLEPGHVGADLTIGSLIKNPGGTLAPSGGYLVGRAAYVAAAARRLTAPGLGSDMGASLGFNRLAYQGLFQAPQTVCQSVKGGVLAAAFFRRLGYDTLPDAGDERPDTVQAIKLGEAKKLIAFCQAVQKACPLDAAFAPEPDLLPGYDYPVIMAGGGFVQGASSELSADGPMRPPYIAYFQGGISLAQTRLALLLAAMAL